MNNYPDKVTFLNVVGNGVLKEFKENMMSICGKKNRNTWKNKQWKYVKA